MGEGFDPLAAMHRRRERAPVSVPIRCKYVYLITGGSDIFFTMNFHERLLYLEIDIVVD